MKYYVCYFHRQDLDNISGVGVMEIETTNKIEGLNDLDKIKEDLESELDKKGIIILSYGEIFRRHMDKEDIIREALKSLKDGLETGSMMHLPLSDRMMIAIQVRALEDKINN